MEKQSTENIEREIMKVVPMALRLENVQRNFMKGDNE